MKERVEEFIINNNLLNKDDTILIAVSGGPDSMALLYVLANLHKKWGWKLFVFHINHLLRGEESDRDAQFVKEQCQEYDIPYSEKRLNIAAYKEKLKLGTQIAARQLRYEAFENEMKRVGANVIVTAHHGDDEAETVLMKLVRGTTPFTKLGILSKRSFADGTLVRPFLAETKAAILQFCVDFGILYRTDSSNLSDAYSRNRMRDKVIPHLKKENPLFHTHIRRYDEWQEEDNQLLLAYAEDRLEKISLNRTKDSITISKERFEATPFPLQRRMIHLILNYLYGSDRLRDFSVYIEQIIPFLQDESGFAQMDLREGVKLLRSYDTYMFTRGPTVESVEYCLELSVPGTVRTPLGEMRADLYNGSTEYASDEAFFLLGDLVFPLYIRSRRAGDKLYPKGLNGSKKVNRVFIDKKVDRQIRDEWPLLVDGNGTVLWIPHLMKSNLSQLKQTTGQLLRVTFSRKKL